MQLTCCIEINAAPDTVFRVLTDMDNYSVWNPWLIKAQGDCRVGGDVVVHAKVGGRIGCYHHHILTVDAPHTFHWCDKGWFTLFAKGDRLRTLTPTASGTEFTVVLTVQGVLSFIANALFAKGLEHGLIAETHALKAYAEQCEDSSRAQNGGLIE